jgi:DNA-binding transcriptional LysR family regulator
VNLQPGQDVLTVSSMQAKIEALTMGLGGGYVPEILVRDHVAAGRLVAKAIQRHRMTVPLSYGWRRVSLPEPRRPPQGLALQWWLGQLESETTRRALVSQGGLCPGA